MIVYSTSSTNVMLHMLSIPGPILKPVFTLFLSGIPEKANPDAVSCINSHNPLFAILSEVRCIIYNNVH